MGVELENIIEGQGETIIIERTADPELPQLISDNTESSFLNDIIQLLNNEWDEGATEFHIAIDYDNDVAIFRGNGKGMGEEGLKAFYREGGSPKQGKKTVEVDGVTRPIRGNFGVGAHAVNHLCGEYVMRTTHEKITTICQETFDGPIKLGDKIPGKSYETPDTSSGTVIEMRKLKFSSQTLPLEKLMRDIKWKVDLGPAHNFSVFVNGNEVKPKYVNHSARMECNGEGEHMGKVTGTIYIAKQKTNNAGVYVRINGVAIGDPKKILQNIGRTYGLSKVIVEIDADDLGHLQRIDREKLFESDLGYMELKEFIASKLTEVDSYLSTQSVLSKVSNIKRARWRILKEARQVFTKGGIDEIVKISFDEFDESDLGMFAEEEGMIYLNRKHPNYEITLDTNRATYKRDIVIGAVRVLARYKAMGLPFKDSMHLMQLIDEEELELIRKINNPQKGIHSIQRIFPSIIYDKSTFIQLADMREGALNYAIAGGLLGPTTNGEIIGRDFIEFQKRTLRLVSLYDIAYEYSKGGTSTTFYLDKFTNFIYNAADKANPFFTNLGTNEKHCFYAEFFCAGDLTNFLQSDAFDSRKGVVDPLANFEKYGQQMLTSTELSEKMHLDAHTMRRVVEHSRNGAEAALISQGDRVQYASFVRVLQDMRSKIE